MAIPQLCGAPKRITASGVVAGGALMTNLANPLGDGALEGAVLGVLTATTTSGTLTLYDGQSASGTQVTGVITPAAGSYTPLNFTFRNGLFCTVGGTIDCTFIISA